jgi:hypothetical protein
MRSITSYEYCLFCKDPEKNYKPAPGIEFICSRCVLLLADAGQDDLKQAYAKALDKGYLRKASAIESFLRREEKHGKRPRKSIKRNFNRERASRSIRNQKRFSEPIEA